MEKGKQRRVDLFVCGVQEKLSVNENWISPGWVCHWHEKASAENDDNACGDLWWCEYEKTLIGFVGRSRQSAIWSAIQDRSPQSNGVRKFHLTNGRFVFFSSICGVWNLHFDTIAQFACITRVTQIEMEGETKMWPSASSMPRILQRFSVCEWQWNL